MNNIRQYVIDYVEGRVTPNAFLEKIKEDSSVLDWIQSIVPEGKLSYYEIVTKDDGTWYQRTGPYSIKHVLNSIWKQKGETRLVKSYNTHSCISKLLIEVYPDEDIKIDTTLSQKINFLLDACPEYLNSEAIESAGILESLMEKIPQSIPRSKRIKNFREELKKMFYIEDQKFPRWIQESEWPLSKTGKPTKFLRQRSKDEITYYYFLDLDTGDEIEIMQAY